MNNSIQSPTHIRAYHVPTKQWRFAVMGSTPDYVRLDPHRGEHLHEFNVYEVAIISKDPATNTEQFTIKRSLNHLERVLS